MRFNTRRSLYNHLAVLMMAAAAQAQVGPMTIAPFTNARIDIIGYSSPEFTRQLNMLLKSSGNDGIDKTLAAILPYCVFLKNNTASPLPGLVARYDFREASGRAAHYTMMLMNQSVDHPEQSFTAAEVILIAPIPSLRGLLQGWGAPKNWPQQVQIDVHEAVSDFVTRKNVLFSIDAVIYPDGQLVGPDRSDTMLRLSTTLEAEKDLVQQLRATPASQGTLLSDLRRRAEAELDEPGDPDLAVDKRKHCYQRAQSFLAQRLLSENGTNLQETLMRLSDAKRLHVYKGVDKQ